MFSHPLQADSINVNKLQTPPYYEDGNVGFIKLLPPDTASRQIISHRLSPAMKSATAPIDSSERVQLAINNAIALLNESQYAMALLAVYEAKESLPHGDLRLDAITESYYGIVNIEIGNHNKAATAFNRVDTLFREIGDLRLLSFHYNNLGLFYLKFKSEKTANYYFDKSLALSRYINDEVGIAISLNNQTKGDSVSQAKIALLEEAIQLNLKHKNTQGLVDNYNNLARQYTGLKQYAAAEVNIKKAEELILKHDMKSKLLDSYNIRSQLYATMGRYEEAFQATLLAQKQSKLLASTDQYVGDMEEMVQKRILSKKNYELNMQAQKLRVVRLTVFLIIAISLLVILSLSLLYYNSRRKNKEYALKQQIAEKEIEHGNRELVNIATFLSSRSEVLDLIQQMINKARKLDEKDMRQEMKVISLNIKSMQSDNEEVSSVMQRITQINEEFIDRLSKKHPQLTKNDKSLILFLRANLTTKQIAILMDCNPKSVNMARYRMRQHLGIENEVNLNAYLKSL